MVPCRTHNTTALHPSRAGTDQHKCSTCVPLKGGFRPFQANELMMQDSGIPVYDSAKCGRRFISTKLKAIHTLELQIH